MGMRATNPVETLAEAVYSCLNDDYMMPDIEYQWQSPIEKRDGKPAETKRRRPRVEEVEIFHFPQLWGSTALGFGGMGGAAMTYAYTTVITDQRGNAAVFFGGTHAYTVLNYNEKLMQDVKSHRILEKRRASEYTES